MTKELCAPPKICEKGHKYKHTLKDNTKYLWIYPGSGAKSLGLKNTRIRFASQKQPLNTAHLLQETISGLPMWSEAYIKFIRAEAENVLVAQLPYCKPPTRRPQGRFPSVESRPQLQASLTQPRCGWGHLQMAPAFGSSFPLGTGYCRAQTSCPCCSPFEFQVHRIYDHNTRLLSAAEF